MKTEPTARQGGAAAAKESKPAAAEPEAQRKKPASFDSEFYLRLNAKIARRGIPELNSPLSDY